MLQTPCSPGGRFLPHQESRSFVNVPGTVIAFRGGLPTMLFERQGKTLRIFEGAELKNTLSLFAGDFRRGRIFSGKKRIVVKEYPAEAAAALEESGFLREMQDYVLYR